MSTPNECASSVKKNKLCSKVADDVMKNGILIGCHQGMTKTNLNYIIKTFDNFLNKKI